MAREMIEINGREGEGGGQILRSSLTLSGISGKPFKMNGIRAGRQKPGLMRQHLTAVLAAAEVCQAEVIGAELNSMDLLFVPGTIKSGKFHFKIGTAGSVTLILQTIIPLLWKAEGESSIIIEGGTHNSMAPTFDFLQNTFAKSLQHIGVKMDLKLHNWGFYPAGGGVVEAVVKPWNATQKMNLLTRGQFIKRECLAVIANLSEQIAIKELEVVNKQLQWRKDEQQIVHLKEARCPGNVLLFKLNYDNVELVISSFGEKNISAERVAGDGVKQVKKYLLSQAYADEYLADQLLLPLAIAGGGSFSATEISSHSLTNIKVIEIFLDCRFKVSTEEKNFHIVSL